MLDVQIGPAFLITSGMFSGLYSVSQLALAYHLEPFSEWVAKALPGAGAVLIGVLFAWDGYRLTGGV